MTALTALACEAATNGWEALVLIALMVFVAFLVWVAGL